VTRSVSTYLLRPALLGLAMLGFGLSTSSYAGNIVRDGSFESADPGVPAGSYDYFNSPQSIDGGYWFVTQGSVGVDTGVYEVYYGQKSVFLNGSGTGPDSLSQTLTTAPGQLYTISFWANADAANTFSVTFGGANVPGLPTSIKENGFPSLNYLGNSGLFTFYTATELATSASTVLTFTASSPISTTTVELDDVSVTAAAAAVPEPSALLLAAIGGLGTLAFAWRRSWS